MRTFETGATRDSDENKIDPEGFYSPLVVERFCRYMAKHQIQADGQTRASDNWQKGMPKDAYMKSLLRHVLDLWFHHRGFHQMAREDIQEALCAILFNGQGYLYEELVTRYTGSGGNPCEQPAPLSQPSPYSSSSDARRAPSAPPSQVGLYDPNWGPLPSSPTPSRTKLPE